MLFFSTIKSASDTFWDYRVGTIKGCEPIDVSFSGSASCGTPLTRDYLLDNHITESGHYCISESAISIDIGEDGTPVDVTLCLHGKDATYINVASGSTLHLCDCTYVGCIENQHGTVSGGHVDSVRMKSNSRLFFESGVIGNGIYGNRINCDGAEIHMTGGTITDGIVGQNNSKVFIYGGDIRGGISLKNGGEVSTYGGYVGATVEIDNGTIGIHGGTINCGARIETGEMHIDGGIVGHNNQFTALRGDAGLVEIDGGTILGCITSGETGTINMNGGRVICERSDDDNTATHYYAIQSKGNVTINGGTVKSIGAKKTSCISNYGPNSTLTIRGGTIQSEQGFCISSSGDVSIASGTFLSSGANAETIAISKGSADNELSINSGHFLNKAGGCIYIESLSNACISGGVFEAAGKVVACYDSHLSILNGYFGGSQCVYSMQSNSNYTSIINIYDGVFKATDNVVYTTANDKSKSEINIGGGRFYSLGDTLSIGVGQVTICDGVFESAEAAAIRINYGSGRGDTTISGGVFRGKYGMYSIGRDGNITLLISSETIIEIDTTDYAFFGSKDYISLRLATDYDGNILYYSSPESDGQLMTVEAAVSYIQDHSYYSYTCLAAQTAPWKPEIISASFRTDGISAVVSCDDTAATVICASYDNEGRMVIIATEPVLLGRKTYNFSVNIVNGYIKVFLIDKKGCPLCESVLLEKE